MPLRTFLIFFMITCMTGSMTCYGQQNPDAFFKESNQFFKRYVNNGLVDYQSILDDPSRLNRLLSIIALTDVSKERTDVRKAYWVNTYNILVIRAVLEYYPISSVDEVPDFFTRKWFKIGQAHLSLDDIEHGKLKEVDKDPKVYFILCRGMLGNPGLINEAYNPTMLTTQIRVQTEAVLNDTTYIKTDEHGGTQLAAFFRENKNDFLVLNGTLGSFINRYRRIPISKVDSTFHFFEVNRTLNVNSHAPLMTKSINKAIKDSMQSGSANSQVHQKDTIPIHFVLGEKAIKKNSKSLNEFFTKANHFFNANVYQGNVDYLLIKKNPKDLNYLISLIIESDLSQQRIDTRKAFWINVYNLLVIKSVIDHYPVSSVHEIPGFFSEKRFIMNGNLLSLNDLEKTYLLEEFKDPRIHFLLCKGKSGSPPLSSEAYNPEILSSQVNDRVLAVLQDSVYLKIDKAGNIQLADWFEEYKSDFQLNASTLATFISKYRPEVIANDSLIRYYVTSPRLNEEVDHELASISNSLTIASITERENHFTSEADDGLLSSISILPRKQLELRLNNNLVSNNQTYGNENRRKTSKFRYTTQIMNLQILYGIGRKTSVGVSVTTRSSLLSEASESALRVLKFRNDSNAITYFRSLNPVVRFNIAEGFFHIRMQNTFYIPLYRIEPIYYNGAKLKEENPYFLQSQLYIYRYLSDYVKVMLELGVSFKFDDQFRTFTIVPRTPVSVVFGLPVSRNFRIFCLSQGVPVGNIPGYLNSYYLREGAGITMLTGKTNLALYYSYNFFGRNVNAVNSFVINLRVGI